MPNYIQFGLLMGGLAFLIIGVFSAFIAYAIFNIH